ncbi:MAG: type II toxin-antitoxin system RelE/ParE family toxin [Candidatus Coatesbacteria bacterium]
MPEGYRIFETSRFEDVFGRITPPGLRERLEETLRDRIYPRLSAQPHYGPGIKKLKGIVPDTWRYRLGSWRLFYAIDDAAHVVSLLTIRPRKDAY